MPKAKKRGTKYPDVKPAEEKATENITEMVIENPARDERNSIPMLHQIVAGEKVEISWFLEALMLVVAGVQEALEDDGKIDAGEAFQIGMQLLALVGQLFRK